MKAYGGSRGIATSFLTLSLEEVEWELHTPAALLPEKESPVSFR